MHRQTAKEEDRTYGCKDTEEVEDVPGGAEEEGDGAARAS